ncbi:allantoate deiminase [Halobacillus sp. A5]|uniref:allantoate deiminase n=1 Tax=Halobacillus sp. A5 TaxID=2880263 RepID=UPI0020A69475|nr:allantoate deiminase [Halobacillus sp. A5]MCP3028427.1 allantoate deiminase [Halobacillus sp. A5]
MVQQSTKTLIPQDQAEELVKWLASFGQIDTGGVHRLLYSPAWVEAQQALLKKMKANGLTPHFDSIGNLFGRLQGTDHDAKTILTGSHIDSVANGGMFDGVYGIAASLLAVSRLQSVYGRPKKSIEVISLCEEEGSRFPLTFWGSGNITGKYNLKDAQNIQDSNGVSLLQAMKEAGFNPDEYKSPLREDIDSFIELHVEQGLVLDQEKISLGLVSHIVGQRRYNISISGESNHAGTTPMHLRKDAMSIAARLIDYAAQKTPHIDSDLVATVGKICAEPNTPNVIAGDVTFSLDIRHHQEPVLKKFIDSFQEYIQETAWENGVSISLTQWMSAAPVQMTPQLLKIAQESAFEQNTSYRVLTSGAGHDAQVFGTHCPTSLIFVPSYKGISHSPKEFTKASDLEKGVDLLTDLLYKLAY